MAMTASGVGPQGYRAEYPADAKLASNVRDEVSLALKVWFLPELIWPTRQIASELFANAVDHTSSASIGVTIVRIEPLAVRLEVADSSPVYPKILLVSDSDEAGRGLVVVEQLSRGWGVELTPNGKYVWAEVPLDLTS